MTDIIKKKKKKKLKVKAEDEVSYEFDLSAVTMRDKAPDSNQVNVLLDGRSLYQAALIERYSHIKTVDINPTRSFVNLGTR